MLAQAKEKQKMQTKDLVMLTPEYVAERLGVDVKTLRNWRGRGVGPKYVKLTTRKIRYLRHEFDRWFTDLINARS